jgi:glutamine synthetase
MSSLRFDALRMILKDSVNGQPAEASRPISEYFGKHVFSHDKMRRYLSKEANREFDKCLEQDEPISLRLADQIATAMKTWASEKGVTHYTHWFQPLNGATAEKHDAFFEFDSQQGVMEQFSGKLLVQQEPDASSFPSGGMRNTFEARGYTGWDPSSPAFIVDGTLCIPTVFISYKGESLDYKTPLLRSKRAVDKAATKVCQLFDQKVRNVSVTLGWEQEYFLVDERLFQARPDLALTGRTLMGHLAAKNQQLEDHYFGSIPERVANYMKDFEYHAHLLGIPLKTRHNEVAPGQFECAPIFEEVNIAVDHNQLLMDLMNRIARHHRFRVLLHEKPFDGVNGSGKHNNWSLLTDTGINLLAPGNAPDKNMQFLVFLINTVKAVHDRAELLKATIVSAGNEHRLGANEAPPAIMSVFLGKELNNILDQIEATDAAQFLSSSVRQKIKLDIANIPELLVDNTDRNRTSPFAFTGNRFEFRAVGSSANCAAPMISLNTAIAYQLNAFLNELDTKIKAGMDADNAMFTILQQYIIESKIIRFEGNGYSQEWVIEATGRGLSAERSVPLVLKEFLEEKTISMFESENVLTEKEIHARHEIRLETFVKNIQIESRVLGDLAINHIIPVAIKYQNTLLENVQGLKAVLESAEYQEFAKPHIQTIQTISRHISEIRTLVSSMVDARKKANSLTDIAEKALSYDNEVKPHFDFIRGHVDKLELICDDNIWPLPKYRELLFMR